MNLIDLDWLRTATGAVLHHATIPGIGEDPDGDVVEELWDQVGPVKLDCGQTAKFVWIPGMFSRMGCRRCSRCCRVNGLPPGIGSPKNDPECRRILMLPYSSRGGVS